MFCINCGTQLPDGSKFCNMCGTPLPTVHAPGQNVRQIEPPIYSQPGQPRQQIPPQQPVQSQEFAQMQSGQNQGYAQPIQPQGFAQAQQSGQFQNMQDPQQAQSFAQSRQIQGFDQPSQPQGFAPAGQPSDGVPRGFAPEVNGTLLLEAGHFTCYAGGGPIGIVQGQGYVDVYDDRIEFRKTSGNQAGFAANPIIGVLAAQHDKKKNPKNVYYFSDIKNIKGGKYSGMIPTFVLEFKKGKSLSFAKTAKAINPKEVIDLVKRYIR